VTAAKTGLGNYLRFTPHVSTGRLTAKVRTRSILRTCR
jgi:hypothetical protein